MPAGSRIRILPETVINQIAAGEVVERPAAVLKELIENALDAGATQIDAEIISGGRRLIAVQDNGCGMCRDDVLLAVERHATSKIQTAEDLQRILSLGFRGEALAAICSVSRFELMSRLPEEPIGTRLVASAGRIQEVTECGIPPGTRVIVRDLFFNLPARRKFLRSERTEGALLRQMFVAYALAFPEIGFSLRMEGRECYRLPGNSNLEERLRSLFSPALLSQLFPLEHQRGSVSLKGFVGHPAASRSDRSGQYQFVNRRPVQAPLLSAVLREAYASLLEKGRHPTAFVFVELPAELVDVNVHPTKREVRFRNPGQVRDVVLEGVLAALSRTGAGRRVTATSGDRHPSTTEKVSPPDVGRLQPFSFPRLPIEIGPGAAGEGSTASSGTPEIQTAAAATTSRPQPPWSKFRIVGQIGTGRYVLLETDQGLVLMDQHAAHERVLYEKLMKQFSSGKGTGQGLLTPVVVSMGPADAERVRQALPILADMGFSVEEFGPDTFAVSALPAAIPAVVVESLLVDIAAAIDAAGRRGANRVALAESIARAACRAAVKSGRPLKDVEVEHLVVELSRCDMPYTCPHGRPALIVLTFRELDRRFGRA